MPGSPDMPAIIPADTASYEALAESFAWRVPSRFNIAEMCCERHARTRPEAPAVIEDDPARGGRVWSFAELKDFADRLAGGLRDLGIGAGDRVAVTLEQGADTLAVHFACFKLGAISVPIASLYGTEGLAYRIADCGARALVTDPAGAAKLDAPGRATCLEHVIVAGGGADALSLAAVAARGPAVSGCADTSGHDPAMIFYTSGTTGAAKGALHGHRVLIGHLPGFQMVFDLAPRPGDVFWTPSVWSWLASLGEVILPALFFGHPVVASRERFSTAAAYRVLAQHRVSCPFLAPAALRRMRKEPPPADARFTLRSIMTGGEVSPPEVLDWTQRTLGATVNDIYGQTEANHIASGCRTLFETPHGAIGKPVAGRRVRILDDSGGVLGPNETGEIAVSTDDPIVMLGYWNQPEATAAKFGDGWLRTGDAGYRDDAGFLYFQGRLDDIILSGGYRIGPEEVEGVLIAHDAVLEAGVVGVRDAALGESIVAFVRPRPGIAGGDALAAELREFVKTRLAAHAYPRRIEFVDALPATSSGKTQRAALRRIAAGESG